MSEKKEVVSGAEESGKDSSKGSIPSPFGDLTKEPLKVDWVKRVAESNGKSVFVPDDIKKTMKEIEVRRDTYNGKCEGMAEEEITINVDQQNAFFAFRKWLSAQGQDVWLKEIGLDPIALKDGQFVINLRDKG